MEGDIPTQEVDSIHRNSPTSNQNTSFRDWYNFNILQRIHMNYVENLSFATTATLAAGLYEPKAASYMGLVFMLGKYISVHSEFCIILSTLRQMD